MKRFFGLLLVLLALSGCKTTPETRVLARFVPERSDDFVFENKLIAGRFYGQALEGNPTSPGIDVWVKLPGRLVANEWYQGALEDTDYYITTTMAEKTATRWPFRWAAALRLR